MKAFILALLALVVFGCTGSQPPLNGTCNCTAEYSPVCGADNLTYGNTCMAACSGTTVAHAGKCSQGAPASCEDSDSGKDVLVKGTVVSGNSSYADSCLGNSSVTEFYCTPDGAANQTIACPDGYACEDGACSKIPPPPPAPSCTDSDGGLDYAAAGSVTADGATYNDVCTDLKLVKEYYCDNGSVKNVIHMCDPGQRCQDGACVEPAQQCVDTDGGDDIYTKGIVNAGTIVSSQVYTDVCLDNGSVREYYCDGNRSASRTESCPDRFSCMNGACALVPCNDTDGGQDRNTKGIATDSGGSHTDYCANATSVGEYYCSGGAVQSTTLACNGGRVCVNGACAFTCSDSDGGNDTQTVGTTVSGSVNRTDTCASSTTVNEYYCNGTSVASAVLDCGFGYSCDAGKCVLTPTPCNDTDGGDVPETQGTASNSFVSKTDFCIDSSTLREYYCPGATGTPVSRDYHCATSACSAGACVP